MDTLSKTFVNQDLEPYVVITQLQAENLVLLVSQRYAAQLGARAPLSNPPAKVKSPGASINSGVLHSLLIKQLKATDPIMSEVIDLSAPVKIDSTAASWVPFYEQCKTFDHQCTFSELIDIAPKNPFAFGACLNHYIDSPTNTTIKAQLAACIANPDIYPQKTTTPTTAAAATAPHKTSPWTLFQTLVKHGSNYADIPITPSLPHVSASSDVKGTWAGINEEQQSSLLASRTIGAFEAFASPYGIKNNWKNLLYAMTKDKLPSRADVPMAAPAPVHDMPMQVFTIPTIAIPIIPDIAIPVIPDMPSIVIPAIAAPAPNGRQLAPIGRVPGAVTH
jgi:hypothetical protein